MCVLCVLFFLDHSSFISEASLMQLLRKHIPGLDSYWPSHHDAVQAFRVFDSEGVGFIKVTLLKRFLGQAQLNADDASRAYVHTRDDYSNCSFLIPSLSPTLPSLPSLPPSLPSFIFS